MTKAKTKRMPGKERPTTSRLGIQRPPTTEPHLRNAGRNTKPSASQPRVIGTGPLRKARPRRSDFRHNTQPEPLNIRPYCHIGNRSLQIHPAER